jgi:hypothetical protein
MYSDGVARPRLRQRLAALFDRAERLYLVVLRATILIVATLLLAWVIWLGVSSAWKISRSPDSVVEDQASVSADELTQAEAPAGPEAPSSKASSRAAEQTYYSSFVDRYYSLFRAKFEPYRHQDDKALTKQAFDDAFLNTAARLEAVKSGKLNFDNDRDDLETLLTTMTEAADKPKTLERLNRYRQAKKVPVTTKVERISYSMQSGWDSSSTACSNWYEDPMGCSVSRVVPHNYTENVTTLQYPKGTESHTQIFRAFQDRYFDLLQQRRSNNASKAEQQRQDIVSSIADGKMSLVRALEVLGAFLALMFFFLLIAIERHQRRISAVVSNGEVEPNRDEPAPAVS